MAELKLSACMQVVSEMGQADQDDLLARIDDLQANGTKPETAQLLAARDLLSSLMAQRDAAQQDTPQLREQRERAADAALREYGLQIVSQRPWQHDGDVLSKEFVAKDMEEDLELRAWFALIPETAGRYVMHLEQQDGQDVDEVIRSKQRDMFEADFADVDTIVPTERQISSRGATEPGRNVNSQGQSITATKQGLSNFWRWFGNSQATDEQGRPQVFFHTTIGDFDEFEVGRATKNSGTFGDWETTRSAIFFTEDMKSSEEYAKSGGKFRDGANVMPVYLRAESPLDLSGGILQRADEMRLEEVGFNTRALYRFDWSNFDDEAGKEFVEAAQKAGYDSVIFWDEIPGDNDEMRSFKTFAVFDSRQIKSAMGNDGTFDASADITRSTQRTVEVDGNRLPDTNSTDQLLHPTFQGQVNFWRWFGDSKVVDDSGRPLVVYHGAAKDFSTFKPSDRGLWFFSSPLHASNWAEGNGNLERRKPNVMPAYLSIKNPYIPSPEEVRAWDDATMRDRGFKAIERELVAKAQAAGHDGIDLRAAGAGGVLVALRPEQIKSATGNDGSFNSQDADITRSAARPLRRGEVLEPTEEENELRARVNANAEAAGKAWGDAVRQLSMEMIQQHRDVFDPERKLDDKALRSIGRTLYEAKAASDPSYDRDHHPLFAEYRRLAANDEPMRRRLQDLIDARVGPPEFEEIRQLKDFPRPIADTPAFKRWFADSKVVDEEGRPIIALHGTNRDFSEFRTVLPGDKQTSRNNWMGELGSWFAAPSPHRGYEAGSAAATADVFATLRSKDDEVSEGAVIYPVFLSIQNPYEMETYEDAVEQRDEAGGGKAFREKLIAQGYDGVVIRESNTDGGQFRDDWIAFYPNQIKSAIGNDGSFDPASNNIVRSAERPIFYSQLELALESILDRLSTMTAPQWKLWLDANASKFGVKKEEVEWSGVKDYLALRGKEKVSKSELISYVRDNGVRVEEVVLNDDPVYEDGSKAPEDYIASGTKYQEYTVPGGENYREVLITLPEPEPDFTVDDFIDEMAAKYGRDVVYDVEGVVSTIRSDFEKALSPQDQDRWKKIQGDRKKQHPPFEHSHWRGVKNVLAHLRVDDRTDTDGKRVLFVNELQSDWGQSARKNGIRSVPPADVDKLPEGWTWSKSGGQVNVYMPDGGFADARTAQSWDDESALEAKAVEMYNDLQRRNAIDGKVPPAPFIGDTKSWVSLAIKRAIMMAVRGGYDKVAFITGEQAADLYDLSKRIAKVTYEPSSRIMRAWEHDAPHPSVTETAAPEKLSDLIGKEASKRLLDAPLAESNDGQGKKMVHRLEGLELKLGGEGMHAFYDRIVPQVANDILKRIGGGKVGEVKIAAVGKPDDYSTFRTDGGFYVYRASDDTYLDEIGEWTHNRSWGKKYAGQDEARAVADALEAKDKAGLNKRLTQPGFDITLKMRQELEGGMPLFSKVRASSTETPNFKNWFGNSVVTVDGKPGSEPLVVYHGSGSNGIARFRSGSDGAGWFARDAALAGDFAGEGGGGRGDTIYPVFLSLQNPLDVRIEDGQAVMRGAHAAMPNGTTAQQLGALGYDGLITDEWAGKRGDSGTTYLAFRPEQIKSIFNDGSWDPRDPNISRSTARLGELNLGFGYKVQDLLASSKSVSWWDKTVGTPYHLAQKHPATFGRVYTAVQSFISDVSKYATRAADLAPSILPKLESLADVWRSPLSAEDVKALAGPVFQGTLTYTRDAEGEPVEAEDVGHAGVVWTDDELRQMWRLDDRQIGLYREFRRAANKSIGDMAATAMVRLVGQDGEGVRGRVLAAGNVQAAADIMADHLSFLAARDPERADGLQNTARMVGEIADQARGLMARGYAPLQRFGQYTVYAPGLFENGYFELFESERDANRRVRELQAEFPGQRIETGILSQESWRLFKGVTPETLELFGDALGLHDGASDRESQVFQELIKLTKSTRSAMKRLIERKGVEGFSQDVGRVLAGFVYSNARAAAQNLNSREMLQSAAEIPKELGDLKDHAIRFVEYAQNPQEEAAAIRGLLFAQYIGGLIASAMVNLTQSLTTTWPTLSMHFGIGKAGRAMTAALAVAKNGAPADDQDLAQAMKRAELEGVTAPQETHHLMAQAQGKGSLRSGDGTAIGDTLAKLGNGMEKIKLVWGKMFGWAELVNRQVAFVAAYRIAREQGQQNPYEFAKKIVADTQFTLNKGNNATWARGPVGATLFTFRKFMVMYLEGLARMWGNGPEGKKAFALSLAILFMLAGTGGFPFADDLDDIIDGFAQRVLGKSFSSKAAKKQFFASILGDAGADFVEGGISSIAGFPIDVSGRLGLGNVVPGTGLLTKKRDYSRDVLEIAGAAGDFAKRASTAAGAVAQGDVRQAFEAAAPLAVTNAYKGLDMWQMGMYRDLRGRKVIDTNEVEALFKMIGFQPKSVQRVQEASVIQQSLIAQNKLRETEIADLWAKGRIERKPDLIADAKAQLKAWNKSNPDSPITIDASQINKRVKAAMMEKAKRLEKTAPREIRKSVREELQNP